MDRFAPHPCDTAVQPQNRYDRNAAIFVWLVWTVMLAAAVAMVARYGTNVPYMDEWGVMVPYLAGHQSLSWDFLWTQHNEHRLPLARLLLVVLAKLSDGDFRAGMYASVVLLATAAAVLMCIARRLRGHWSFADAFFPLTLLHWGHFESLLMGMQLALTMQALLAAVLLGCIVLHREPVYGRTVALAVLVLTALGLCNGGGIPLIPPLALWLLCTAVWHWRYGGASGKRWSLGTLALALVPLLVVAAYFYHFHFSGPRSADWRITFRVSLTYLASALGPGFAPQFWPLSGGLVPLIFGVTMLAALVVAYRQRDERYRCLGLLLFSMAIGGLILIVGWGRGAGDPHGGFPSRYIVFGLPLLWCCYYVWDLLGKATVRNIAQVMLLALACATLLPNFQLGKIMAANRRHALRHFEKGMTGGVPTYLLAARYGTALFPVADFLPEWFVALHKAGVGEFRKLNSPEYQVLSLPLEPTSSHQMQGKGSRWQATGSKPSLVFPLPHAMQVDAIRIRYTLSNDRSSAPFRVSWAQEPLTHFGDPKHVYQTNVAPGPGANTLFFPVDAVVDQLRLDPDVRPCNFQIHEIVVYARPSGNSSDQRAALASGSKP